MALDQMCIAVMLLQAEPLTYTSVDLLLTFDIYSRSMCFISKVSFLISNTRARFDAIWNVPTLSCLERNAPLFLCCFCFFSWMASSCFFVRRAWIWIKLRFLSLYERNDLCHWTACSALLRINDLIYLESQSSSHFPINFFSWIAFLSIYSSVEMWSYK